jgi:hypothetical protein
MNDYPLDLIVNQLKTYDETELCDLLHITSEDLLRRFEDKVRQRRKYLEKELEIFPDSDTPDNEREYEHGYQELNFDND